MKQLLWTLIVLCSLPAAGLSQEKVKLTCRLTDCAVAPALFRFNGLGFEEVQQAKRSDDGAYVFEVPGSQEPSFYYVGQGNLLRPMLLGPEKAVMLQGTCGDIRSAAFLDSKWNKRYEEVKEQINELKRQTSMLVQQYRVVLRDSVALASVKEQFKALDEKKMKFLDSLKLVQPYFGKIAALETYLSFDNNNPDGKYVNEIDYFAAEYFRFANFKDKTYNELPWVFEAFQNYANTLLSVGLSEEAQKRYFNKTLARMEPGSGAHMMALSALITVTKQKNNPNYRYYAEMFIEYFATKMPTAAADLQNELNRTRSFEIGGLAPDFTQKTPSGKDLSLSDLRGKVLLVDFWASWCGPCRRENPNVVKLYNQYKDKGFEILGVSLDRDYDSWVRAIEADQLTWPQVSDLQYWNNAVAQTYGVRAIPHTILLDAEGRIIARNLRGEALAQKLQDIFK